jgi:Rrf2 family protein
VSVARGVAVKLSAKTEYACLAALELAVQHASGKPVRVGAIADRHGIPSPFLVQILSRLKGAGLVTSTRGVGGGYQLSRSPRDITLANVLDAMEGSEVPTSSADSPLSPALLAVFSNAVAALRERLDAVTLAEFADRADTIADSMYHI